MCTCLTDTKYSDKEHLESSHYGYADLCNLSISCNKLFRDYGIRKCQYPNIRIRTGCVGKEYGCLGDWNMISVNCQDLLMGGRPCRTTALELCIKHYMNQHNIPFSIPKTQEKISFQKHKCPDCSASFKDRENLLTHCMTNRKLFTLLPFYDFLSTRHNILLNQL